MKRPVIFVALFFLLSASPYAQTRSNNKIDISRPYWLKYSLVFYEEQTPRVFPDNIVFTQEPPPGDARSGSIMRRGRKMKIYSASEEKDFIRVKFRHWPEIYELETEYEVLLKGNFKKGFQKVFGVLFSDSKVQEEYVCPGEVRTRREAIKCLGFPMIVTRDGDVEEFHYILEFVGPNPFNGYDGFTLKIKHNKVIDVSGYI